MHYSSDRMNVQHNQLEYLYDEHENWTERIIVVCLAAATQRYVSEKVTNVFRAEYGLDRSRWHYLRTVYSAHGKTYVP